MDSGTGYHFDIEYKIRIAKRLGGDSVISVFCDQDPDNFLEMEWSRDDISRGLTGAGVAMRRHFDKHLKEKFLAWLRK